MTDRLLWIPGVLRAAGLDVYEMPGWDTLGEDRITVEAVIGHHTATSAAWQDGHVALLLKYGRPDLAGPLSQLGLERDGTFVCIASGRANHNGRDDMCGFGNDSIGIEAYNSGLGEPWPAVQLDAYDRGIAALLSHVGKSSDFYKGHRETTSYKIDPTGIDLDAQRARVHAILNPAPNPIPTPLPGDDSMAIIMDIADSGYPPRLFDGPRCSQLTPEGVVALTKAGVLNAGVVARPDYAYAVSHALLAQGRPTDAERWRQFALTGKMPAATTPSSPVDG